MAEKAQKNSSLHRNQPLWMPPGSIRGLLAISAMGIAGTLLVMGTEVPKWFVAVIMTVVSTFFAKPK